MSIRRFVTRIVYNYLCLQQEKTMKVHLLSHITECVKDWGPLWAYSCFSFEGHTTS